MQSTLDPDVEQGNGSPPVLNSANFPTLASSGQEKVVLQVDEDAIFFPEGGLRAWMAVLGG